MVNQETDFKAVTPGLAKSNIIVRESESQLKISIPPKGIKGAALVTLIVIALWMFTILVWSVLLAMVKPVNMLYSLPFWAIGFWTLLKAIKMIRLKEEIIIESEFITLRRSTGQKREERKFERKDVKISLIEGSYYDYSGLNKRGQFPAVIYNEEAFGFGERSSTDEKNWLVNFINEKLNNYQYA
ncbi:MAG TPA: hypothetical protein VK212_05085 [Lentimicrobium sp.]|nr:hypothetical protein [Lentimicrobium sp.]